MATLGGGTGQQPALAAQAHRPAFLESNSLIAAARSMGDRVEHLAIHDGEEVGWPGLTKVGLDRFSIVALGTDLYDGLPGVALFLAYLGQITGESRYTNLARTTLSTLRRHLERQQQRITRIGGFEGWGGIIYALAHLAVLWRDAALLDEALGILPSLRELIDLDEDLDVIDGAAGCIGSLIALHRCSPSDLAVSVAVQCGDRLLACGQEQSQGIAWTTRIASKAPLTGFAHGAAGIAWALLELGVLTGEERFATAAREAAAYERSLFSQESESWPDLRSNRHAEESTFTTAWCFGAPGIGLARLRALDHWPDQETAAEIHAALRTTLRHGFGSNHSLCHGDLGNLELLVQAAQHGFEPGLETKWKSIAGEILEEVAHGRPRCATPFAVDSPGLMTGLSGIGYGLLRLAAPELVPSILLLEPPRL
jgi:type 2 lantibiotic biosynthesis protein LanM